MPLPTDVDPIDTQVEAANASPTGDSRAACRDSGSLFRRQPRACLPEIDTDRPHRTDTPATVPPGYFQSELGVLAYEAATAQTPETVHFLDVLLKLGLSTRVDVQVGYSPIAMRQRGDRAGWLGRANIVTGRSLFLRSKVRVYGVSGSPIALTVAPVLSVPLSPSTGLEGGGTLLFGAELAEWLSWEVNGSLFYEEEERNAGHVLHFVPCTALTARLFGPLKVFGEAYYERPLSGEGAAWAGTVDGGLLWLLTPDLQLDTGIYVGTSAAVPRYTAFFGLSFRL